MVIGINTLNPAAGFEMGASQIQQLQNAAVRPELLRNELMSKRLEAQQAQRQDRVSQMIMAGRLADKAIERYVTDEGELQKTPELARFITDSFNQLGLPLPEGGIDLEQVTPDMLYQLSDQGEALRMATGKATTTVESAIVKDEKDNLYSVRTDTAGRTQYAPMSPGAPAQPFGRVSMVSKSTALTPEEGLELASKKAGAVSEAQKQVELDFAGRIEQAKVTAREKAKSLGTAVTDYQLAKAALPELQQVVNKLRALAPLATSTRAGRAWDTLRKELGFKASEGATARARYIAIINNQVLPLLKQTFGGAFTEAEGAKLEATLGDPNASPDEKIAQLDEFIQSEIRSLETGARKIQIMGGEVPASNIQKYRDMYEQIQDPAERRKFIEQAPQNILDAMGLSR